MQQIHIIGGGLAGTAAAISALDSGANVRIYEKSKFPRHKVCGEFLSPAALRLLEELGVRGEFESALPSPIRRAHLHFGRSENKFILPETAWGLSRARLDDLLLCTAMKRGAELQRERMTSAPTPLVLANGRHSLSDPSEKGHRLFGFKAHFIGPLTDAVELYFFGECYVGVNPAGSGITNVCGIAPEHLMQHCNFDQDKVLTLCAPLRERLAPLTRSMEWLSVGPLRFENKFHVQVQEGVYCAGDALSFVDPFTGSGMLAALRTGILAGTYAATGKPSSRYVEAARATLEKPFRVSSVFRWATTHGWAERLGPYIPGRLLFSLTRPHLQ